MLKALPKQNTQTPMDKPKPYKGGDMGGQRTCSHTKGVAYPSMGSYKSGGKAK